MYARWNEEYYQHVLAKWEWLQNQAERAREKEKELNEKGNTLDRSYGTRNQKIH